MPNKKDMIHKKFSSEKNITETLSYIFVYLRNMPHDYISIFVFLQDVSSVQMKSPKATTSPQHANVLLTTPRLSTCETTASDKYIFSIQCAPFVKQAPSAHAAGAPTMKKHER